MEKTRSDVRPTNRWDLVQGHFECAHQRRTRRRRQIAARSEQHNVRNHERRRRSFVGPRRLRPRSGGPAGRLPGPGGRGRRAGLRNPLDFGDPYGAFGLGGLGGAGLRTSPVFGMPRCGLPRCCLAPRRLATRRFAATVVPRRPITPSTVAPCFRLAALFWACAVPTPISDGGRNGSSAIPDYAPSWRP